MPDATTNRARLGISASSTALDPACTTRVTRRPPVRSSALPAHIAALSAFRHLAIHEFGLGHDALVNVERVTPSGLHGLIGAVVVNTLVALAFWIAVTSRHGFSGNGAISYHYEEWLGPVAVFLAATVLGGLAALVFRGWRWFGTGVLAGAVTVALLDLAWTFVYFVSQGS